MVKNFMTKNFAMMMTVAAIKKVVAMKNVMTKNVAMTNVVAKNVIVKNFATAMIIITTIIAITFCMTGCDGFHYHPVTEDRTAEVGAFDGIALDGVGNVVVYLRAQHKVFVTAHSDIVEHVTTVVDSAGVLRININDNAIVDGRGPINVELHAPSIANILLGGSGHIRIMPGSAERLYIAHTGVGGVAARDYAAREIVIKHRGSGRVEVTASDVLNVAMDTRNGDVTFTGSPVIRVPNTDENRDAVLNGNWVDHPNFNIVRPPPPHGDPGNVEDVDDIFNADFWIVADSVDGVRHDPTPPQIATENFVD